LCWEMFFFVAVGLVCGVITRPPPPPPPPVVMADPKLSMFSSYLSVLANMIYDLITGVGLEPGQMMMYVYV